MGGETWVEKANVLAPVSDTLTVTLGLVEVVGGTVESMNKGVESGVVDCCYEETGG